MFRDTVELRETLIEQVEIQRRAAELGREITHDYRGKIPLLVAVLTGGAVFHADLIRPIDLKLRVDFIALASYGTNTENLGEVQLIKDADRSVWNLDVIVVEGIVDTGLTADYLLRNLGRPRVRFSENLRAAVQVFPARSGGSDRLSWF